MLAGPPTRNWILKSKRWIKCSAASRIKCTPFWVVIRPTNANSGTESSSSPNWKYFCWINFLAVLWSGAAASSFLILDAIGIPLGKANGCGFWWRKWASEEPFSRSSLYDLLTVAHWSEQMIAHLLGLMSFFYHDPSMMTSVGSWCTPSSYPWHGSR